MNSCLVKYSKCKCMYIWVIVIFPSLGTLWEQHLHPTPCHQGQEQQLWPAVVRARLCWLSREGIPPALGSSWSAGAWSLGSCGDPVPVVWVCFSWHSWEVGQSQNLTPVKGSQHRGSSALLSKLATVKSTILTPKPQPCCSWRILTQSFRGM